MIRAAGMIEIDVARLLVDIVEDEDLNLPLFSVAEHEALKHAFEYGGAREDAAWYIRRAFDSP